MPILIGTAGWSIPRQLADGFPDAGSALERYSGRFRATEINSSFYRSHRPETWARWRDTVPNAFRFSVKVPKQLTHVQGLRICADELDHFLGEAKILGEKLAILLVQLPPKLALDRNVAMAFFKAVKQRCEAAIVCEPRHLSWFTDEADEMFTNLRVARVAADPSISPVAARPGGWAGARYWRLHGSPVMYRSTYLERLDFYADQLLEDAATSAQVWCIFDNTASSAAANDALTLIDRVNPSGSVIR